MKTLKKIVLWALVIGICIIILGVAGLYIFFPKETVKRMAIDEISSTLNRKVTIENISMSLWGGLGAYLEEIRIANADGFPEDNILSAEALDIKLQFWPLLKKEIKIDRLILEKPMIFLRKASDGAVNYRFGAIDSAAREAGLPDNMPDESKLAVSAVSFEDLLIKNGRCRFIDDSSKYDVLIDNFTLRTAMTTVEPGIFNTKGNLQVESLGFKSDSLTLPNLIIASEYDLNYDFNKDHLTINPTELILNDIPFDISGELPRAMEVSSAEININSEKARLNNAFALVPDLYQEYIEKYKPSGLFNVNGTVNYDENREEAIKYDLNIGLRDLELTVDEIPGSIAFEEMNIAAKDNVFSIKSDNCRFNDNPFEIKGEIKAKNDFEAFDIDGSVKGQLDLSELNGFLPEAGNPELTGDMEYDLSVETNTENISGSVLGGSIDITGSSYKATTLPEPIEKLSTRMILESRDIIIENLEIDFTSSDVKLEGRLRNAFPYFLDSESKEAQKPYFAFKLKSQRLDIDRLFPEAAPGQGSNVVGKPVDSIPPIILPDINGKGRGHIDTLIYTGIEFTDINSIIDIKDRTIRVGDARGNVYSGRVQGDAVIDLNNFERPQFDGKFKAEQIEANDFLTRFTSLGGHLYGKFNLEGNYSATGLEPEDIIRSLSMDGDALFNEARLVNFDLVNQLSQQFNFDAPVEEKIKDLTSHFRVQDGRVHFDALKFFDKNGDWELGGSVGILDGSLDYSGQVLLSESASRNLVSSLGSAGALATLFQKSGTERIEVPFKLGGTYKKPKLSLDLSFKDRVQDSMEDKVKDGITDGLKKLFGK